MNGDGDSDVTKKIRKLSLADAKANATASSVDGNASFDQISDSESSSDSSSDESEIRAPLELMGEFLSYVRQGNWEDAKKLCQMILIYEPQNPEALQFKPLIDEKIQIMKELAEASDSDDTSEEEESSDDEEDEDGKPSDNDEDEQENDEDSSDEEDKTEHLKNKLIFLHDVSETKIWRP